MDFVASRAARNALEHLDGLCLAHGGIPNISKDSRLPKHVVASAYPEYDLFRSALAAYDSKRYFRSDLSRRLAL
jgi:decaprenylphospho-beta-D-ribofuranose 2-oxidase